MGIKSYIIMLILMLTPMKMLAWGFDVASVEALIDDHKVIRDSMKNRIAIEAGVYLLQNWTNDTIKGYKKTCDLLDKYDRSFDILDLVLSGTSTVLKVRKNYTVISDRIGGIRKLLSDFHDKCLRTGRIEYSDKLIIEIGNDMITAVCDDVEELYKSLRKLLAYQGAGSATGLTAMSTSNLIQILNQIDRNFDHITKVINHGYIRLRGYILARLGPFFRRTLYRSRPVSEVATDALTRWLEVTRRATN